MARLLRSYGVSKLRPPVTIGAAVTFRPLKITLSVTLRTRAAPPQRVVHSKLQAPTVVDPFVPPVTFTPEQPSVNLAKHLRQQRQPHPKIQPPAVVAPPVTFRPVQAELAPSSRLGRVPHPHPLKPAVVAAAITFGPIKIKLVRTPRQPSAPHSRLYPPAVVAPAVTYARTKIVLASSSRLARVAHSFRTALPPPAVIVVPDLLIPLRVVRAISSRLGRRSRPVELSPAPLAAAPVTYDGLHLELAALIRSVRYRRTRSFYTPVPQFPVIPPPTVEQLKTRIFLTRRGPVRLTKSRLRPPTVTAPGLVFAPIHMELAPSSKLGRATHPKLKPPTVIAYPVTAEQRFVSLYLAPSSKLGRRPMWQLHPPAAIIAQIPPPYLEGAGRSVEMLAGAIGAAVHDAAGRSTTDTDDLDISSFEGTGRSKGGLEG